MEGKTTNKQFILITDKLYYRNTHFSLEVTLLQVKSLLIFVVLFPLSKSSHKTKTPRRPSRMYIRLLLALVWTAGLLYFRVVSYQWKLQQRQSHELLICRGVWSHPVCCVSPSLVKLFQPGMGAQSQRTKYLSLVLSTLRKS